MEIQTAAASLASGSDAVILKHPQSVATISKMIQELMYSVRKEEIRRIKNYGIIRYSDF